MAQIRSAASPNWTWQWLKSEIAFARVRNAAGSEDEGALKKSTCSFDFNPSNDHSSANPEGNPRDEVVAEAVLEAVENFLATVADDFREPHAIIDSDEQSALV